MLSERNSGPTVSPVSPELVQREDWDYLLLSLALQSPPYVCVVKDNEFKLTWRCEWWELMMQAEQRNRWWCRRVKQWWGSPHQAVMAPSWELPARSMVNPEQPLASCFTADWGQTIKKRHLCISWSKGEALARSPCAAAMYEKAQTTLGVRVGWGPWGVTRVAWSLGASGSWVVGMVQAKQAQMLMEINFLCFINKRQFD